MCVPIEEKSKRSKGLAQNKYVYKTREQDVNKSTYFGTPSDILFFVFMFRRILFEKITACLVFTPK